MAKNDYVTISFVPPIHGELLYELVKKAAEKANYMVSETPRSHNNLRGMEYVANVRDETVKKRDSFVHYLTLQSGDKVPAGGFLSSDVPASTLSLEINLHQMYASIPCGFHPLDANSALEDGADSIRNGKPTSLDQFVTALHDLYRHA